jgi:CheY-like chemotaxis protein
VHLSKTIMNLVSNAAEAISDVGTVTVSTRNETVGEIRFGYEEIPAGDYVTLTIADTGSGIAEEDMERLFEPFYTRKVMGRSGTGLGMAVVWGTVRDHRGVIDIDSREGEGSTFTLYFPASPDAVVDGNLLESGEDLAGRGERVLLVDDVVDQREIGCEMLTRLGYRAEAVASGEEAVEHLRHNRVDLVVLDMIMEPGMDGLETYRRILELHPGQRAVIASGFSETDRVREARRLGAGTYLRKPFLLRDFAQAVRRELDR